jgi:tetratricopeptide (TPR) repeat protein
VRLIAASALLLAGPVLAAPSDPTRYAACIELAGKDPAGAMQMAYAWRIEGGGVAPRHCLAVAQMHARHYEAALKSYDAAGQASEAARDGQAVALWRQAAEAALIAEQPAEAVRFLTRALGRPGGAELSPRAEADLLTSRAEAQVALNKPEPALADLTRATTLAPDYFTPWLLQATLARRQGDLAAAEAALLKAAALAPESADVELEAGNIAAAKGDMALARQAWEAAVADAPDTPAGQAAAAALGRMAATLPEKPLTDAVPPATPR